MTLLAPWALWFLIVGGGVVARVQPGPGTRVLWIHGYTLDSSSWQDMWRRLPGWHHFGLDLPGHGESAPIAPQDDLVGLGRRVAAFCREQEIRHVVALSFGTVTATQAALEAPDWFEAMVLGAPTLAGGPSDTEVGRSYWQLHQLYRTAGPGPVMRDAWMSCVAWNGIDQLPELRRELGALVARHRWTELAEWGILRLLQPAQNPADLARIRAPLLILIGDRDLPAFHEAAEILLKTVPRCRRVVLDNTDHLCMLQSPEPSARHIAEHLQAHGATLLLAEASAP